MTAYTKQYYSIGEVSRMLELPIYTLRFWESEIPMFNPSRSPKGTRRFTPADIELVREIKNAVYERGMRIDGVISYLNKTYRRQPPRHLRICKSPSDAIALLDEVDAALTDAHSKAKIKAVVGYLGSLNSSSL